MYRPAGLSDDSEDEWECNFSTPSANNGNEGVAQLNGNEGLNGNAVIREEPGQNNGPTAIELNGNLMDEKDYSRCPSTMSQYSSLQLDSSHNSFKTPLATSRGSSPYPSRRRPTSTCGNPLPIEDFRMAIVQGNVTTVEKILNTEGIAVDQVLKSGWSGLMFACSSGKNVVVDLLLRKGANPNVHKELFTALMAACASCQESEENLLACAENLMEHGAKVDSSERHRMTALMFACKEGRLEIVKKLVDVKADVNLRDNKGWSGLSWACHKGHGRIVNHLLSNGANPSVANVSGQRPSDVAMNAGFPEIANLLERAMTKTLAEDLDGGGLVPLPEKLALPTTMVEAKNLINLTSNSPGLNNSGALINSNAKVCGQMDTILNGINLDQLVPVFREHKITLELFLGLDAADFEKMGIDQLGTRQKLCNAIQDMHKQTWSTNSLPNPSKQKFITLPDAISMMKNIHQHVRYIQATVGYLRDHVENTPRALQLGQSQHSITTLADKCTDTNSSLVGLGEEVKFFKAFLDQVSDRAEFSPADLVVENNLERGRWKRTLVASLASATICVTALYFVKPSCFSALFSLVPYPQKQIFVGVA